METYRDDLKKLRNFLPENQYAVLMMNLRGEERDAIGQMIREWNEKIAKMPKTYEQDGKGNNAVAHLHYFIGGCDWYILEKDMEREQHQAFGYASLMPGMAELGYISIPEVTENGAELDLYWTPKTLGDIKRERGE